MAQSWQWRADATLAAALLLAPALLQCRSDERRSSSAGAASKTPAQSSATPLGASAPPPSASAVPPAGSSATEAETTDEGPPPATLAEQRTRLLGVLRRELALSDGALHEVQKIIEASDWLGQGNPRVSQPSMSRAECRTRRAQAQERPRPASAVCGAPNMVALFDPERGETERDARACIDQYEFPNVPCEYPVVWVRSSEASSICHALGKRLCDAHEWEGGCAGRLLAPEAEYPWSRLSRVYEQRGSAQSGACSSNTCTTPNAKSSGPTARTKITPAARRARAKIRAAR